MCQGTSINVYLLYLYYNFCSLELKPINSNPNQSAWSVVIFIIDALSQQNFMRSLENTKEYLDRKGGTLFTGHHKVAIYRN